MLMETYESFSQFLDTLIENISDPATQGYKFIQDNTSHFRYSSTTYWTIETPKITVSNPDSPVSDIVHMELNFSMHRVLSYFNIFWFKSISLEERRQTFLHTFYRNKGTYIIGSIERSSMRKLFSWKQRMVINKKKKLVVKAIMAFNHNITAINMLDNTNKLNHYQHAIRNMK